MVYLTQFWNNHDELKQFGLNWIAVMVVWLPLCADTLMDRSTCEGTTFIINYYQKDFKEQNDWLGGVVL